MIKVSSKATKYFKKINYKSAIVSIFAIILLIILVSNSGKYILTTFEGVKLWANNVLPALFPYFVITKILIDLDFLENISLALSPFMSYFFHASHHSCYIFLISILSGYPIGAKLLQEAYNKNLISSQEAHRIVTFTSLSGPSFIIGTVATILLKSSKVGFIILFCHITSAIINGLLFRNYTCLSSGDLSPSVYDKNNSRNIFGESIYSSMISILLIGGYIAFFYTMLQILIDVGIINFLAYPLIKLINFDISPIICGLIEVTRGCFEISNLGLSLKASTVICTALITFGGLCIHSQAFHYLKTCGIHYKFFLYQKISQTIISIILAFIITNIFL